MLFRSCRNRPDSLIFDNEVVLPDKERRGLQPLRRVRHLERDFRRVRVSVPAGVGIDVVILKYDSRKRNVFTAY